MRSGTPPLSDDCVLVPTPVIKLNRGSLNPRPDLQFVEDQPAPVPAIRRWLYREYRDQLPVKAVIPGHGLLLLGSEGWSI